MQTIYQPLLKNHLHDPQSTTHNQLDPELYFRLEQYFEEDGPLRHEWSFHINMDSIYETIIQNV